MLNNYSNYGVYEELIKTGRLKLYSKDFNSENIDDHFFWILNMLRDGIETDQVQKSFVNIQFDNVDVDLTLPDLLCNVIMWDIIIKSNIKLSPKHILFDKAITRRTIKNYVDIHFIDIKRKEISNIHLNNMIDDMMFKWCYIDEFNGYLANTMNLEDFADLMETNPEFNNLIHSDLSNVPLEDVKKVGMDIAHRMIEIIKDSDHCLANFFKAGEGVNPKQFKEVAVNIGTKPDGRGGVYPTIINTNFLTGGVNDVLSFFIEESTGRVAQIIVADNVGTSGHFARLLGLNNLDTTLHKDPNYVCGTNNFQELTIVNDTILKNLDNRYYRLNPNGVEYLLKRTDTFLIGKTILLRSPMTCESHANGHGVCYRCYGDLAYTNNDINIGKIAAEYISSELTQMMLSAKHLLESAIKKIIWPSEFERIFELDYDIIKTTSDDSINLNHYKLLIDRDNIDYQSEFEEVDYNEFITKFQVLTPRGEVIDISTEDNDELYITPELNTIIREKATDYDSKICVDFKELLEYPLFVVQIHNYDLSTTLKEINSIINKKDITNNLSRNEILQKLNETFIKGGLHVSSVHGEIILSNQIRSADNILEKPNWIYPNEQYEMLSLSQALSKNPSIIISLSYQGLSSMLYNPLTFRKNKPSFMDLFFMKNPVKYLTEGVEDNKEKRGESGKRQIISFN